MLNPSVSSIRRSGSGGNLRKSKEHMKKSFSRDSLVSSDSSINGSDLDNMSDDNSNYDEDQDWGLDEEEPEEQEEAPYTIMPKDQLLKSQKELIESVRGQVSLSLGDTALLLMHFKWNSERLLREYFDKPETYLRDAGIFNLPIPSQTQPVTCIICYETIAPGQTTTLGCGHKWYCNSCWRDYLKEYTSRSGPQIVNAKCIYPKCPVKLNFEIFRDRAEAKDYDRYAYFLTKNFVESDKRLTFCPNAACGNGIRFNGIGRPLDVVDCTCGAKFCFSCGLEQHSPISCKMLDEWRIRNQDDQESLRLIKATSKPCCHCGMATERTQGCNHMTCRKEQGGCGGEWCWMCRGDWKTHGQHTGGFYSCNKYEASDAKKHDDDATKAKNDSDRFLHYYNRFFNHDVLNKHAEKLKREILTKMEQFREQTNQNPDFMMEAVDLLVECRRILKFTYVYGFYLDEQRDAAKKNFFEYLQANAEGITERLTESLNSPLNVLNPEDLKNRIRVTRKYTSNLVKGIEEGLGVEATEAANLAAANAAAAAAAQPQKQTS